MNNINTDTQNIQHDDLHNLREFLRVRGKIVVSGVFVILIIIAVTAYYQYRAKAGIKKAALMLLSARSTDNLDALLAKYPSSPSAPLASMKLAKVYFDSEQYDLAIHKYAEFQQKFPEHHLSAAAELGRIHCQEAKGQLEEAAAAFAAFSTARKNSFLTPQAILGQARCLTELGRLAEARALYEDFITGYPESYWIPIAEDSLINVIKKLKDNAKEPPITIKAPLEPPTIAEP